MVIPTALLVAAGAQAATGLAKGIAKRRAAKAKELTPEEEAALAAGRGLTERQRGGMTAAFLASQAGAQRQLEASGMQQAAARGLGGATSGRQMFLQEQAEAAATRKLKQEQNIMVEQAEQVARAQLKAQKQGAAAEKALATGEMVAGVTGAVADAASIMATQGMDMELAELQIGNLTNQELLEQLNDNDDEWLLDF